MAGGGGAWKVAYADFVTAMMALFLVLWLTAQSPQVKQAVARSFTNPFQSPDPPRTGMLEQSADSVDVSTKNGDQSLSAVVELSVLKRLSQQILEALHSDNSEDLSSVVQMRIDDHNLRINVFDQPDQAIFEPGSTRLTKVGRFVFTTLAWQVTHYPQTLLVDLEGHTGASETGGPGQGDTWDLSVDRANAVRRLMMGLSVPAGRFRNVSGYGASQPMNKLRPDDSSNRRVSLILKIN